MPAALPHGGITGLEEALAPEGSALRRTARAAFINRNFALLWWGQAISSVGDYAWDTALVLWIATTLARGQSWAPLAVSGAILAATIPQIVVGPIAGVFVDRWDKRRTMVAMTAIQAALAALLMLPAARVGLPLLGRPHLPLGWLLAVTYADIALITSCAQFFLPAQLALIKDIVPAGSPTGGSPRQDQALEMTQAIQALGVVIGPPVAAALVFGLGVQWALLANVLSFVVSFAAATAISAPPAASSLGPGEVGHFSREFLAGVGYVLGHRVLRTILVSEILTWLGFGCLQTLGYFFITGNLHAPPSAYGWLGAVFGFGAIAGGVLVTIFGRRLGLARVLWLALVTSGAFVNRAVAPDELRAGAGGGVPLRRLGHGNPGGGGAAGGGRVGAGLRRQGDGGDQSGGATGGAFLGDPGGSFGQHSAPRAARPCAGPQHRPSGYGIHGDGAACAGRWRVRVGWTREGDGITRSCAKRWLAA
jgi:MFS family permease